MRIYYPINVVEAAKRRVEYLFDEFPNIIVNVSGGKDSTVILDLALKEARKRDRLPLKVFFLDTEAEWSYTVEWMRNVMYSEEIEPYWLQVEFQILNATTFTGDRYFWCWEEGKEKEWLREKEEIAIKKNVYNETDYDKIFQAFRNYHFKHEKTAIFYGIRAEENPRRFLGMTSRPTYKNITWGRKNTNPNHFNFSPIYDWSFTDVWKYIHENKLKYNKIYDLQYMHGVSIKNMRVSNLHHETALSSLQYLPEVDIELYNKLIRRLTGIHSYQHFYEYNMKLPHMFKDWKEYREYLLEKLIPEEKRIIFRKWFDRMDAKFEKHPDFLNILKSQCQAIICNDWDSKAKLENIYRVAMMEQYRYETKRRVKNATN